MTPGEKKLAAALLRIASDQFSNHGCNDFDLVPYIPESDQRDALVLEAYGEIYDSSNTAAQDFRLGDSTLMDLMADRLEDE